MMKERIQEIYDSLQERLRSPFILTFIIVWCIHHWRIIFYIMTYDDYMNQGHKLEVVEVYINKHGNWWGMIWPSLLWSFVSIVFYYLTTILMKILSVFYNRVLAITYSKINEKRKLVTKEEYSEAERKIKRNQMRNEVLQKRVQELNELVKEEEEKYMILLGEKSEVDKHNEGLSNTIANQDKKIESYINTQNNLKESKNILDILYANAELKQAFSNINFYIQRGDTGLAGNINTEYISFFEANEIVQNIGKGLYTLTEKGKELNRLIINEKYK